MDDLIIRELQTMPEFTALVEMQQVIWGMVRGEATSPYIMNAARHNGGVVLGAEYQGRLVGFCFGFVGWRDGGRLLWSHMAGVLPDFHGRGIGLKLKLAQRQWALAQGYTVIGWTFDPLQRGNASFNFRHLRGSANTYYEDYYGAMTDTLNAGLASDRLEVRWLLDDPRVAAAAAGQPLADAAAVYDPAAFVLRTAEDGVLLRAPEAAFEHPACCIEIPYSISALKRSDIHRAQGWQLALRWAMQTALRRGCVVVDFVSQEGRGWYVLRRP